MASVAQIARAVQLASLAVELVHSGKAENGTRAMREAISLAPENAQVKDAFSQIQVQDTVDQTLRLCEKFTSQNDLAAGREALRRISSSRNELMTPVGEECLYLLTTQQHCVDDELRDSLVAALLQYSPGARTHFFGRFQENLTEVFDETFAVGDKSVLGLVAMVLDRKEWPTESSRQSTENDVFQLFVAKLKGSGPEHSGRAMKGIVRLLPAGGDDHHTIVDEDAFGTILACLDCRLPQDLRNQATVATAKYLEVSKDVGQECLSTFITTHIKTNTNDDLVTAFSAAATVFPLVPTVAGSLFLSDGFVKSLAALLENSSRSNAVEQAALDMLSAACIDGGCREAISKHCLRWLYHVMKTGHDQVKGQAAVILAKVKGKGKAQEFSQEMQEAKQGDACILPMFEAMLLTGSATDRKNSIEGLAYYSMQPKVKEEIAKNKTLLSKLTHVPVAYSQGRHEGFGSKAGDDPLAMTVSFGTLTILDNLTRYRPQLSEEQKRLSQLKAYANASTSTLQPDPLEDDSHVEGRCKAVLDADVVPYMANLQKLFRMKGLSCTTLSLMGHILLSLAKTPSHRGKLAQQSAIGLLRIIYETELMELKDRQMAAHAIARIFISLNPKVAIHPTQSPTATILQALSALVNNPVAESSDSPRDLLPQFEALLALTNLASDSSLNMGDQIVKAVFETLEDLLLSNTLLIQRAATELICNLMSCAAGFNKFSDGSKPASRRLHILLALADTDDVATRQAAGGALAMLTEFDTVVKAILARERGLKILLALCEDKDVGCVYRGVFCIRSMVLLKGETGKKAREAVTAAGGIDILKHVLQSEKAPKRVGNQDIINCSIAALKALTG